jgi:hypothetical protein
MNTVIRKRRRVAVFGAASLALTLLAITASARDSAGAVSSGVAHGHSDAVQRCYRGVTGPASL